MYRNLDYLLWHCLLPLNCTVPVLVIKSSSLAHCGLKDSRVSALEGARGPGGSLGAEGVVTLMRFSRPRRLEGVVQGPHGGDDVVRDGPRVVLQLLVGDLRHAARTHSNAAFS